MKCRHIIGGTRGENFDRKVRFKNYFSAANTL
jgi:hypothetical protein